MSLKNEIGDVALLFQIDTNYYTTYDVPITYAGNTYEPHPIEITAIQQGTSIDIPKITIKVDAVKEAIRLWFSSGNPVGKAFKVSLFEPSSNDFLVLFDGIIAEATMGETTLSINAKNKLTAYNKVTLREANENLFPNIKDITEIPIRWGR